MRQKKTVSTNLGNGSFVKKRKPLGSGLLVFAIVCITGMVLTGCGAKESAEAPKQEEKPATVVEAEESLVIATADLSETAAFFPVDVDGTRVEVVAVKAPDGTLRTAFNTCQVCYDSGRGYYEQEGDVLVCQNCGNQFPMEQVEIEAGGCNPWPIFDENKTVTEESISIPYEFLKDATVIFANWKGNY